MAVVFPVIGVTEWSRGSWMPNQVNHRGRTHAAIDIYAERGSSIVAPVAGTVSAIGVNTSIGGNWVQLKGDDGYTYYFAHMEGVPPVEKGQKVEGGQFIGAVGNSGSASSTSTHTHFTIKRDGVSVNPIGMLESAVVIPNVDSPSQGRKTAPGVGAPTSRLNAADSVYDAANEVYAYDQTPSTTAQLNQYREDTYNQAKQPDPVKQRASYAMRATLQGMSNLVKQYGFNTGIDPDTGIDEDIAVVPRARKADDSTPR